MIFITGDTHGSFDFNKLEVFAESNKNLTKSDYMIIVGDFGGVWSEDTLEESIAMYESLPFSILFIDGNHENFDMLNSYDVEIWNGGKTHKISDNIRHLMRGQVFNIEGQSFFAFGGAVSIDKHMRVEGISWWKEEVPSYADYNEAHNNLEKINYKVDYILTHSIDKISLKKEPLKKYNYIAFETSLQLNYFEQEVKYNHWYFGHYHIDEKVNSKKTALYNEIYQLEKMNMN